MLNKKSEYEKLKKSSIEGGLDYLSSQVEKFGFFLLANNLFINSNYEVPDCWEFLFLLKIFSKNRLFCTKNYN